jgi:hypothetical protein
MLRRLTGLLCFLTAAASLNAGLATFKSDWAIPVPVPHRWIVSLAILDLFVPTIYLLASTSLFATNENPRASSWITSTIVLLVSTIILVQHGFSWKFVAEVAGPLISIAWIIRALAKRASTIVLVGTAAYLVVQGEDLILSLHMYWNLGGSIGSVFMQLATPALVLASLIAAVATMRRNRPEMDARSD